MVVGYQTSLSYNLLTSIICNTKARTLKSIETQSAIKGTLLNVFKLFHSDNVLCKDAKNMASNPRRIAVCQMTSTSNKAANLSIVENLVENASYEDAKMIFFPEACDYLCDNIKDMLSFAEPIIGGPTVDAYRKIAQKYKVWLSMGGLHEKDDSNPKKVFNTHIIINSKGKIVQTYRKLHLFDVEIPEKNIRLKESDFASPGEHIVTPVETPVGKIGMAICYDMRFPEFSTQLAILGSDILTYPSAFTYVTGQAHWDTILRCRAIENQCFVIAAAQIGQHNIKRKSWGHAIALDAWGSTLATCGDKSDQPSFVIADLDYGRLKEVRNNMPVFSHRRGSAYSLYPMALRNRILPIHRDSEDKSIILESLNIDGKPDTSSLRQSDESNTVDEATYPFGHQVRVLESCTFYKSSLTYAFVNLRCVVPGHVLVAPLRIASRLEDLTREEVDDFFKTVVEVVKVMEKVHNVTSSTVTVQDGPDAGRTVEHIHCHVMPRKRGDFKDNDLIYLELARHDRRLKDHPMKPARTLQEMRQEAAILRDAFQS